MSDLMFYGVLRMPYEMAMSNELSRIQFYDRAKEAADRVEKLEATITDLRAELALKQQVVEYEQRHAVELEAALARSHAVVSEGQAVHQWRHRPTGTPIEPKWIDAKYDDAYLRVDEHYEARTLYTHPAAPAPEAPTAAPSARTLPPLPEMESLADLAYALNTPDDWDADYRSTWQKLQVAARNKMQWRIYALDLYALLAATTAPTAAQAPEVAVSLSAFKGHDDGKWYVAVKHSFGTSWVRMSDPRDVKLAELLATQPKAAPVAEAPTEPMPPNWPAYGIIDPDYARYYSIIRATAWQYGYAIGMHGSFTRDLDLIAVPWADDAHDADRLIKVIVSRTDLTEQHSNPGTKPHGRKVWTLLLPGFGDPRWIDLSITPREVVAPATEQAKAPKPYRWLMITPEAGNEVLLSDKAEADRYAAMDGRSITPLYRGSPAKPDLAGLADEQVIELSKEFKILKIDTTPTIENGCYVSHTIRADLDEGQLIGFAHAILAAITKETGA